MESRKPSWKVWANVPTVELLGAVALSLDIDPRKVKHSQHGWMAGGRGPILDEDSEFQDRLEVATRNLRQAGPIVPVTPVTGMPAQCEVSIPAFGQWARGIGWELPPEFPCISVADIGHTGSATNAGRWPWGDYETDLLRKLEAAAKKFWRLYDPADSTTAPTNQQVIDWLTTEGVAQRTAEVMATILRAEGLPAGPRK